MTNQFFNIFLHAPRHFFHFLLVRPDSFSIFLGAPRYFIKFFGASRNFQFDLVHRHIVTHFLLCFWVLWITDNSKIGAWSRDLLDMQFKYPFPFFFGLSATIPSPLGRQRTWTVANWIL